MRLWKLSFLTAVLLLSTTANAATYYVATSGNDANAGTLAAPFRTITKAAQVATAGDSVQVRGGVYAGSVVISSKGTAAARISFRNYAGETPVIDGAGMAADKNLVTLNQAAYVDFSGFEVRNATRIGICGWGASNVNVTNNTVYNSWRNGIYFGWDAFGVSKNITIDGNTVRNNVLENQYHTWSGGWANGIVISYTDGARITNNKVYNNDGEGVGTLLTNNGVIEGNQVYDNFSVNVYLDNSRFVKVNRNLVYSTGNTRYYRGGYPAAGIATANEFYENANPLSDVSITNNIVVNSKWGFYYGAYDAGGGLKNSNVTNNTFYGATHSMIWIENDAHANSVIQNNIFYAANGTRTMADVAGAGVTYRRNNWYGGAAGAASGSGDVAGDPKLANPGGLTAADYMLRGGSPVLEAGLDLPTILTVDYWNHPRSAGIDLGAHEYTLFVVANPTETDTIAPSTPAELRAKAYVNGRVELNWAAATDDVGVTGYRVYRNGASAGTVSGTTWTDTNAAASTTYSYEVAAIDAAGNESPRSEKAKATTPAGPDTAAPSTPSLGTATATNDTISLQWGKAEDNVNVTGYKIYRNGTYLTSVTARTHIDRGLTAGTAYTYQVTAVDAMGNESAKSNTVTVTTTVSKKRRAA